MRSDRYWAMIYIGGFLYLLSQSSAQEAQPLGTMTLQGTLDRFIESDYFVKMYRAEWQATDADVEQLLNRDGWFLELGGRKEILNGKRLETRDESLGRSPRRVYSDQTERENYLMLGLSNSFLEETRQRKADAAQEKIKRLDDVADFDLIFRDSILNAALAFTGAYHDKIQLDLAQEELVLQKENLRVIETRLEEEGALTIDVLEEKAKVANINRRLTSVRIKLKKKLDFLRDLWGYPDLEPEMLGEPYLPEVVDFAQMDVNELVDRALNQRDDIESSLSAKKSYLGSSEYMNIRPEVDLSVSSRYGHFDRDFADEGRHETTYDIRLDLEVSIPLSMKRRNEARNRRFNLNKRAREYEILALKEAVSAEIREAFDDYLLSCEEIKVQELLWEQAIEHERMTQVTVETMPEAIKGDPARDLRQAHRDRIKAESDYRNSIQDRLEDTLIILSLLGELSPDYRGVLNGEYGLEK